MLSCAGRHDVLLHTPPVDEPSDKAIVPFARGGEVIVGTILGIGITGIVVVAVGLVCISVISIVVLKLAVFRQGRHSRFFASSVSISVASSLIFIAL